MRWCSVPKRIAIYPGARTKAGRSRVELFRLVGSGTMRIQCRPRSGLASSLLRGSCIVASGKACRRGKLCAKHRKSEVDGRSKERGQLRNSSRVAQLASSCVRSIRNLRVTSNSKTSVNCAISVHSGFPVPAAPSFCEAGPPVTRLRRAGGFHHLPAVAHRDDAADSIPIVLDQR